MGCTRCPHALHEEFSLRLILRYDDKEGVTIWQQRQENLMHIWRVVAPMPKEKLEELDKKL